MILRLLLKLLHSLGAIHFTFGFTEPGVPVIPSAVMWQNTTAGTVGPTITGTLTSGATTCTSMAATNGLTVGMPISGTGIAPGTTIAAIVSGTAITLSLAATASGAQALTFTLSNPQQSIWGPGASFPSVPAPQVATDAPDCPFNVPDAQVLVTLATYTPAPGRGIVTFTGSATTAPSIQYNINGTWTDIIIGSTTPATVTTAYIMADGVNVRFNNKGTTATCTYTFYRERSSKSTSQ
jgi:hypothetical protein